MPARYVFRAISDGVPRSVTMRHDASIANTGRLAAHQVSDLSGACSCLPAKRAWSTSRVWRMVESRTSAAVVSWRSRA